MNLDDDDSAAGKGTLRPQVGQSIHLTELRLYNLDGFRLSWSPDNTARVFEIPPQEIANAVRCCKWATCREAEFCCAGRPHEYDGRKTERCFDRRPYIAGGVLVWDEPVKANIPICRKGAPAPSGTTGD
jgi:hypothetical protein